MTARAKFLTPASSTDSARARIGGMAKGKRQLVEVRCPCCEAKLQIDPTKLAGRELQDVIDAFPHRIRRNSWPRADIRM